ncbi:MAG: hypothetical protein NC231_08310 [Bacillus sp. (in: Bacteria)]|nr:hypothetical protein [Bacillus sp. (in: firmicutes)]MCM1426714.1 hypothetical protein [Eubacterium sp.]
MKTYLLWFYLMIKRMIKKPAYLLLGAALPLLCVIMTRMEQGGASSAGVTVGILFDGEMDAAANAGKKGETEAASDADKSGEWNERFLDFLEEQDSVIQFRLYESESSFVRDIEKGELDCGVMLPVDIGERLMTDDWRDSLIIYQTSSSGMTEIVKERIAAAAFTFYSEESYVNYIEETDIFAQTEKDGVAREDITAFAKEAYETHLMDGSTFAFNYHGESYVERPSDDGQIESDGQTESDGQPDGGRIEDGSSQPIFRLKGVLAVCIFLSGLCGLLMDFNDRKERRFVRMAPEWVTTAVNIWIPTIYTSVVTLLSLLLTGWFADGGGVLAGIGKELCHLIFYQFLIVAYCSIIRLIIRKQELAAAAIPILTLASIVCCPVWIRLALYLPVFQVLEKMFPVTYYLML